ncbi:hypothetical protein CUMW_047830, partial [Citrus unshiu]
LVDCMRNHAKINGVVFVRGQTAFISKKLLESLMKEMAAPMVSIDIESEKRILGKSRSDFVWCLVFPLSPLLEKGEKQLILRLKTQRNYAHAGKDNNYGADDVIQRPMLSELITNKKVFWLVVQGWVKEALNPICNPDEHAGKLSWHPKEYRCGSSWPLGRSAENLTPADTAEHLKKFSQGELFASTFSSIVCLPTVLLCVSYIFIACKDLNVIEESFLASGARFVKEALNPICNPDEHESFLASGARFVKEALNPICNPDEHAVAYRLLLAVKAKLDPKDIDVGLHLAVDAVAEILRCRARASTFEEISQKLIGSLNSGNDSSSKNKVCIVKAHEDCEQERTKVIMHDLAILTGGQVVISDDEMVILGGAGSQSAIEERRSQLRSAIELSTSGYEVRLLKQRLHYLSNTAAVFKVGPCKLPDKLNGARLTLEAVKRAMDQKIVPGAGIALLHVSKELDKLQSANVGANISIKLLQHALKAVNWDVMKSGICDPVETLIS